MGLWLHRGSGQQPARARLVLNLSIGGPPRARDRAGMTRSTSPAELATRVRTTARVTQTSTRRSGPRCLGVEGRPSRQPRHDLLGEDRPWPEFVHIRRCRPEGGVARHNFLYKYSTSLKVVHAQNLSTPCQSSQFRALADLASELLRRLSIDPGDVLGAARTVWRMPARAWAAPRWSDARGRRLFAALIHLHEFVHMVSDATRQPS